MHFENLTDNIIPEIEVWEFHEIFKRELEKQNREREKELFKKQFNQKAKL